MNNLINIIKTLRIKQWVKNSFVFMPIIFGGKLLSIPDLEKVLQAFVIFCVTASGIYIINDIADKKTDRLHDEKKKRPIASGKLAVFPALCVSIILIISALFASFRMDAGLFSVVCIYTLLHLLYSMGLKKAVILDVIAIAIGFELRIWGGALVVGIIPSIWLQLCVFVLAIFLGSLKRRHEKISLYDKAAEHRDVLGHYKIYFIDQMTMIAATLCVVFYGLYAISPDIISRIGSTNMAYTIPFVIYGIFRYLYVTHANKSGGDPGEILLTDIPLLIDIILWISVSAVFVYLVHK